MGQLFFTAILLAARPAAAADDTNVLHAFGGFGIIVLAILAVVALRRLVGRLSLAAAMGPRALFGQQKVVIDTFDRGVLYRDGRFETVLPAGTHWINPKGARIETIDTRPLVLSLGEAAATADRRRARLTVIARIQVVDPRAAVESSTIYRDEYVLLITAAVRKLAAAWTFRDLNLHQAEFAEAARAASDESLLAVGGRCVSFDISEIDLVGDLPDTDERDIGFRAN